MEQYAIYLRKSRADVEAEARGEGETLARHDAILSEFALQRGYYVAKKYREIVSGDTIAARPQMQQLLADVNAGMYAGVIVTEISRLARGDTKDQGIVAEAFKYSGALIITPNRVYDPADPASEDFFDFELFLSRQEYKYIRRRMHAGLKRSVLDGNYLHSHAPYGYDKIKRSLKPNADAEYVRIAFDAWVRGASELDVCKHLTAIGAKLPSGKAWTRWGISYILQNPAYIGLVRYHQFTTKTEILPDGTTKSSRHKNPNYDTVPGNWEPLIDKDTFDAAQARFGAIPRKNHSAFVFRNPLAGLLRCAKCGMVMDYQHNYPSQTNMYPRYRHKPERPCKVRSCKAYMLYDGLANELEKLAKETEAQLKNESPRKDTPDIIAKMRTELKALQAQLDGLYDKLERGIYSDEEFLRRRATLQERISHQEAVIADAEAQAPKTEVYKDRIVKCSTAAGMLRRETDTKELNDYLKGFIREIRYDWQDHVIILDVHFL